MMKDSLRILALLPVPFIFALLALWVGPDYYWDLRNYHLYNGYAFINHRLDLDLAPAGMQTYFNPYIDAFYYWGISHFHLKTVHFVLGFIQGLNFVLIFFIGSYVLDISKSYQTILALLGISSIWFIQQTGSIAYDSLLAIFPLSSLLLILSSINSLSTKLGSAERIKIITSGLVVGIVCGFKLTFAPYALALCLAFFALPVNRLVQLKLAVLFGFAVFFGLLISGGYWFYLVFDYSGNPLFPQFNNFFHSDLTSITDTIRDTRFFPRSISEKLFYPIFFTAGPWRIDAGSLRQFGWVLIYGSLLLLLLKKSLAWITKETPVTALKPEALFLVSFFCIAYIFWQLVFSVFRYLITIELLIPIMFTALMSTFFFPKNVIRISCLILGLVMVINLLGYHRINEPWIEPTFQVNMPELKDIEPKAVFLADQPLAWIIPLLNTNTPYIQLDPNFTVTNAYWSRAKNILANRVGNTYLVYEVEFSKVQLQTSQMALKNIGLSVNLETCKITDAFISSKIFKYGYCEINGEKN